MENNNRTWEALSMKDRASFIKLAVQNGYKDIGSIRSLYNKYQDGGKKDSARLEYVMRESQGTSGNIFKRGEREGLIKAQKALNTEIIPEDRGYSNDLAYTGALFINERYHPDYNYDTFFNPFLADTGDLNKYLGYRPVDFVDAYVSNKTPFKELGVIEDKDSGEKALLKKSIKEGYNPKIYQSYRDTLPENTVRYLDSQLKKGIPKKGDNITLHNTNDNHALFRLGNSNLGYDGQNITAVHVKQPDGKIAYKLVDYYDFNPDQWSAPVKPKVLKEGLQFIEENGNPYIMTSPWFYKPEWDKKINKEYYRKALGGPLYNQDNPIESFQGNPYIPIVRY